MMETNGAGADVWPGLCVSPLPDVGQTDVGLSPSRGSAVCGGVWSRKSRVVPLKCNQKWWVMMTLHVMLVMLPSPKRDLVAGKAFSSVELEEKLFALGVTPYRKMFYFPWCLWPCKILHSLHFFPFFL